MVASTNYATVLFFFVAETWSAYGRNTVIIIGEESVCFRAPDFETITAHCVFQPPKPILAVPPQGGREAE